jgi:hypothetical protein
MDSFDFPFGSVSHGTMVISDIVPKLRDILAILEPGRWASLVEVYPDLERLGRNDDEVRIHRMVTAMFGDECAEDEDTGPFSNEETEAYVALCDVLDKLAPNGVYFGASEGDGTDIGFWPVEFDPEDIDCVQDDPDSNGPTYIARSYLEEGNLTRGQYGDVPYLFNVRMDDLTGRWVVDPLATLWGAWDSDHGIMAPWPAYDVTTLEEWSLAKEQQGRF